MAGIETASDKYTAAIEVSNACRMFYVSRLQTAETLKDRLVDRRRAVRAAAASSPPRDPDRPAADETAPLESVIARLHKELATLIDIDLKVMRQLLMLNDQVEEMKWRRRQQQQQQQRKAMSCATPGIDDTDWSDSEPRWSRSGVPDTPDSWSYLRLDRPSTGDIDDDDDEEEATLKYPTPSALSLLRAGASLDDDRFSNSGSVDALDRPTPDVFGPVTETLEMRTDVRMPADGDEVVPGSEETPPTDCRTSTGSDSEPKSPRSPTKLKEHELHSANAASLQDFCTYVEMLI